MLRPAAVTFLRPISFYEDPGETLGRRGLLSLIGVVWQGAIRFITNALVGHIGGPTALGAVATATSSAQILSLLGPTSSGSAASRYVANAKGGGLPAEAAQVARHLRNRTSQATVLLGVASIIAWALLARSGLQVGLTVAILFAGYSGYAFTRGLQFGAGQVMRATAWDLVTGTIGLVGVVGVLWSGVTGPAVLVPLASAYVLFSLVNWPWRSAELPDRKLRREIDKFIALGVVGTLASAGFQQSSILISRAVGGAYGAGQYAASLTLATPGAMLASSLSLVLFPSLAATWGSGDRTQFKAQTDNATRVLATGMVGLFGVLILVSSILVHVVWGQRYGLAATLLPVIFLAICLNAVSVPCVSAITTRSLAGMAISMVSSLIGLGAGLCAWALLVPRYGVIGVAIGYLIGVSLIAGIPIAIVWRRDGHVWRTLAVKIMAGLSVVVILLTLERCLSLSSAWDLAFAALFLAGWLGINRVQVRVIAAQMSTPVRRE